VDSRRERLRQARLYFVTDLRLYFLTDVLPGRHRRSRRHPINDSQRRARIDVA
jgi:hypothetical protein